MNWLEKTPVLLIRGYQIVVSPFLGLLGGPHQGCKFQPTCSEYAKKSIEEYGFIRGTTLALKRISRCHPFSQSLPNRN